MSKVTISARTASATPTGWRKEERKKDRFAGEIEEQALALKVPLTKNASCAGSWVGSAFYEMQGLIPGYEGGAGRSAERRARWYHVMVVGP